MFCFATGFLSSLDCPGTCYIDQMSLKHRSPSLCLCRVAIRVVHVCAPHPCSTERSQKRAADPLQFNWSWRWFRATLWVLGIRSSVRTLFIAVNHGAVFPVLRLLFLLCVCLCAAVLHTFNPSIWETGRWISELEAILVYIVLGQSRLHNEVLIQ